MLLSADVIVIAGNRQPLVRRDGEQFSQNLHHFGAHLAPIGFRESPRPGLIAQVVLSGLRSGVEQRHPCRAGLRPRDVMTAYFLSHRP